jgi:hypothetical protein
MPDVIDDKELKEREEEAIAIAEEDDQHFVDYCIECASESRRARKDILDTMTLLWDAYQNIMAFGDKEAWQSRVTTNKPFTAVERAVSIIRKAFRDPNYINVEGVEVSDKDMSYEVEKALLFWSAPRKIDFPRKFANSCRMALATGTSLELIPRWENGMLLDCTEPWKILRDPDALTGEPWSGNYCIHEEWLDMWTLHEAAKDGYYINIDKVKEGGAPTGLQDSKEEIERRKKMYWDRTKYRKSVLVREFNGIVLDKKGDMLLPNAKYTIAGEVLIRKPEVIPFVKMRWAGTSFVPIPHILRYDGRGLIEGVFDIWRMLNNMLSLTMDDFSWVVNRMREIAPELMLDPTDLDFYPGKEVYRTTDMIQYPVVKDVLTTSNIEKILAVAQYVTGLIEEGDFVNAMAAGLPGYREQITKGEVEIKTEQSLGIFDSIGAEIESGAVNVGYSIFETMVLNWNGLSDPTPTRVLGDNEFTRFLEGASLDEKKQFLSEECDLSITGISSQLKQAEKSKLLMAMKAFTDDPKFQPFFKLKEYLDEVLGAIGMYKAPFIKTKEELEQTQIGEQLVEALGKLVASGGPEVQAKIKEFLDSLGVGGQAPEVGGQPPEIGSETQAEGGPAPAPIETAPAGMPPTA